MAGTAEREARVARDLGSGKNNLLMGIDVH